MPFTTYLQSFLELRLSGLGPPELVSIVAELLVAATLVGPLVLSLAIANWFVKRAAARAAAPPQAPATAPPTTESHRREAQAA